MYFYLLTLRTYDYFVQVIMFHELNVGNLKCSYHKDNENFVYYTVGYATLYPINYDNSNHDWRSDVFPYIGYFNHGYHTDMIDLRCYKARYIGEEYHVNWNKTFYHLYKDNSTRCYYFIDEMCHKFVGDHHNYMN